ncbi:MAG TPA: PKD domain-containing protein [Candidatus Hydrogenedentes bacterium]|nr:PKD domain-containing protein [Candidatus Hydrogenedentota bacterium]
MHHFREYAVAGLLALALIVPTPATAQQDESSTLGISPAPAERPASSNAMSFPDMRSTDLRLRVAQLMLVTLSGRLGPSAEDRALLERYPPGGALIPTLQHPKHAAAFLAAVRNAALKSGIPAWIGTDLFTVGRAERTGVSQFVQFPSLLSLAAIHDDDATRFVAESAGEFLTAMGFDLHMGPRLSLAPEVVDAKGSLECLGSDPDFIGSAGVLFANVLVNRGVLCIPMGFPGGGANRVGKGPAVLLTPKTQLPEADLAPYARVVANGVPMVHVDNVLVPLLDNPNTPASLSRIVMRDILREQIGFEGVVLAGPMDAAHIGELYDFGEAAVMALEAGADMLLWNSAGPRVMRAIETVVAAVETGRLPEAGVNAAADRVLALKHQTIGTKKGPVKERQAERFNKDKAYAKEVQRLERLSITLVQNRDRVLPLDKEDLPLGVTGVIGVKELSDILVKKFKYVLTQPMPSARHMGNIPDFDVDRIASRMASMKTAICILSDDLRPSGAVLAIRTLKEHGVRVIVLLLGYPTLLPSLAEADAILAAYCHPWAYIETVKAMSDVLQGFGPVALNVPDKEIRLAVGQSRDFNALHMIRCPAGRLPVTIAPPYVAGLACSFDPRQAVKKVSWDFGDGKRRNSIHTTHTYRAPGRYPVTLTADDRMGETATETFHIVVE